MNYLKFFTDENKSGWKCVETKLKNNHPEIHSLIIEHTNKFKLGELSFKEKVYHFIHSLEETPKCKNCNKKVKFLRVKDGYQEYCSTKCANRSKDKINKTKEVLIKKYGYDTTFKIPEIKEKVIKGNIEKYGVDNVFKSPEIQANIKQTNIEKYGDPNPNKTTKVRNRYRQTCLRKYGFDSHLKSSRIRNKIKNSLLEKHGVDNVFKLSDVQDKIKATNLEKYGNENILKTDYFKSLDIDRSSKIEKDVREKLHGNEFRYNGKDFDIKVGNVVIEVDGEQFHPDRLLNLNITQTNTAINDYVKNELMNESEYEFYRVKVGSLKDVDKLDIDFIKNNSYVGDYSLDYTQKIISKEYFKKYIEVNGKDKLRVYVPLLLKFIRTFHPAFPYPTQDNDLNGVMSKIRDYDYSRFHDTGNNTFNNNTSTIGNFYLKSIFKSYWSSSYKGKPSPIDMWVDDEKMLKVIAYRIGLNDTGEVYDFSLRNLVRGISALRGTISFFKPVVAAGIYKHYIGDKVNPTVFDPCSGFGGRLLGFKSLYPNGKYIGVEPNKGTFKGLCELSGSMSGIDLNNVKLEAYNGLDEYDIGFTSIPYYDLEDYGEGFGYSDFDDWRKQFIGKLLTYPRMVINMNYKLCKKLDLIEYIDGYLINGKSHFSKGLKAEVLVKINF